VPFLVLGGTALGTGRGETISPVLVRPMTWHWVVAIADDGLSTPEVYREVDRQRAALISPPSLGTPDDLMAALRQKDPEVLAAALGNDMQAAALTLRPELARTLDAGTAAGALIAMISGSGPTCLYLASDAVHAARIAATVLSAGVCRKTLVATGPVPGARVI
jgi:4-diphosphocytidyl-2-C-methyl-D-erythritol kinase